MKFRIANTILVSCLLMFTSCFGSKSVISNNSDLSQYEYASIINDDVYHIPAELMEYEIQLYDAVACSGLELVSDHRIYNLNQQQQKKLLLVKYGIGHTESETFVTVNFIDFMSGRPVASCKGSYGLALSNSADLKRAIKRVAEQISKTFAKK